MRATSSHENSTVLKMLYFKIEAVSPLAQLTFDDHNDTCLFRSHNISEPSTRVRRCRGGIVSKWVSESEMEKRRGWLKFMFSHLILRLLNSNTDFDGDAIFRIPYSVSRLERKPDCVFFCCFYWELCDKAKKLWNWSENFSFGSFSFFLAFFVCSLSTLLSHNWTNYW